MNLRVIQGGKQAGQAPDTAKRRKQLSRIRYCSRYVFDQPLLGPRMTIAITAAVVVGGFSTWAAGSIGPSALIAGTAFAAVLRFGRLSRTWADSMDLQLAEYDPIDRPAYVRLQRTTEAEGFTQEAFYQWLSREYVALDAVDGIRPASSGRTLFLRKKVYQQSTMAR